MRMRSSLACVGILALAIFLAESQGQAPIDEIQEVVPIKDHPVWSEIVPEAVDTAPVDEILLETQIEASVAKKVPFQDTALGKLTGEAEKPNHSRAAEQRRLKRAFGSAPIPAILRPLEKPKAFGSAGPKPLMKWKTIHEPYPQFPPPLIPRYISGETDDPEDEKPAGKNSVGCDKLVGCNGPPAEAVCVDTAKDCDFVVRTGGCGTQESKTCMKSCNLCPQGVPPASWEQASVGPGGHLYLGPSRRRVGAGFGRRRAHKIPKAVKKLLTKKQIKKLEPKPKPGTLIYSHHAILRAAAPGNDGLPIIHVKPKPKPKKKAPHKKAPGSAVAPTHVSKVVPTKPTGSAKKAARKAIEKKATSMMPKAIAKAFAKAEKKQVKKEEAKKKPKVEKAKPKPFVFSDAKERAAKWAAKKEGTIVSKDHA
jgi:hypothetical protein